MMTTIIAGLMVAFMPSTSGGAVRTADNVRTCEPIKIEMCKGLGYDVTGMPNMLNNELQQDAKLQLQTFSPLIQYGCSKRLKFFLCSAYVPMCTEKVAKVIGPCRPLCEDVRDRCLPVLQQFGFPWPPALNCSKFPPENNQYNMCMSGPEPHEDEAFPPFHPITSKKNPYTFDPINANEYPTFMEKTENPRYRTPETPRYRTPVKYPHPPIRPIMRFTYPPAPPMVTKETRPAIDPYTYNYGLCDDYNEVQSYYFINRTQRCAHLCSANIIYTEKQKNFAELWMGIFAILCFVSTLITFVTFMLDSSNIKFPERPIMFISMCYCIYSLAYIVRLVAGREDIACHPEPQWMNVKILIQDGLENTNCALVFLLVYFFGTASAVWWLLLTIMWFLAAGKKWSHEAIEAKNSYFHLIAWTIPAVMTIAALVLHVVDADELTGMCSVGNQDTNGLLWFVLGPQMLFLVSGTLILITGFYFMYRTRHNRSPLRGCPANMVRVAEKLEGLVLRVGIFSVVYILPSACIVGSYIYEYKYRELWLKSVDFKAKIELFYLRIFMCLIVGAICGIVIWPGKIWTTWRKLIGKKQVTKTPSKPVYYQQVKGILVIDNCKSKRIKSKAGSETTV